MKKIEIPSRVAHGYRKRESFFEKARFIHERLCRPQAFFLALVLLVCGLMIQPTPSTALLGSIGKAFSSVVGGVGRVLGAPFGGFVDGLTAPTIRNAENTGKRLVASMDSVIKRRIDQIDGSLARNIELLDSSMEARILQLDMAAVQRIAQVDQVLEERIQQIDDTLQDALAETDIILQERLNQLDEMAAKRIGNLDVVATKATFTLEETLIRLIGISCLMIFLACAVWRIYAESIRLWRRADDSNQSFVEQFRAVLPRIAKPVSGQLSLTALSLLLLFGIFAFAPGGARSRALQLLSIHEEAFENSLASMDLRRASYHADQLRLLRPLSRQYRGLALKAELVRDLFSRPALLKNLGGINEVLLRIDEIERHYESPDPDIEALKAFVIWQASPTKVDELKAALLCQRALELAEGRTFALRGLAENYLRVYLSQPLPDYRVSQLRQNPPRSFTQEGLTLTSHDALRQELQGLSGRDARRRSRDDSSIGLIQHAMEFNEAAAELNATTSRAYLAMLRSNADLARLGPSADREKEQILKSRAEHAQSILDAWSRFESRVIDDPFLNSTTASLASFYFNDALWVRARYYLDHPESVEAAPLILEIAEAERSQYTPPRAKLAESLLGPMSPEVRHVIELQEYHRFVRNERKTRDFEVAFAKLDEALAGGIQGPMQIVETGLEAAALAAELGLNEYLDETEPVVATGSLVDTLLETIREKTLGVPHVYQAGLAAADPGLRMRIDQRTLKFL